LGRPFDIGTAESDWDVGMIGCWFSTADAEFIFHYSLPEMPNYSFISSIKLPVSAEMVLTSCIGNRLIQFELIVETICP
jgi:hypothetical protein